MAAGAGGWRRGDRLVGTLKIRIPVFEESLMGGRDGRWSSASSLVLGEWELVILASCVIGRIWGGVVYFLHCTGLSNPLLTASCS